MNAATQSPVLWGSGIAGAMLSGVANFGLTAFLTAHGSGPLTFLLFYAWIGVLTPAAAIWWLIGRPWSFELRGSLFEHWPQMMVSWLVDAILLGAVVAVVFGMCRQCFGWGVKNEETT